MIERDAVAELHDSIVRTRERQREEALRIEYRQAHLGEALFQRGDRDFSGARPVCVATHAVDHGHQQGTVVREDVDAILVLGPIAGQTQPCVINLHLHAPLTRNAIAERSRRP